MTAAQKALLARILGAAVRSLILGLGAWVKATGKLPGTTVDSWVNDLLVFGPDITSDIMLLAGVGWSIAQKWLVTHKITVALNLPAGSSEADLAKAVKA